MTKRIKSLLLIICILCSLSLLLLPAFADEIVTPADPSSTTQAEPVVPDSPKALAFSVLYPGKTDYVAGDYFDPAGFIVGVLYEGDSSYKPSFLSIMTCTYDAPLVAGMTSVPYTFCGGSFEIQITVTGGNDAPVVPPTPAVQISELRLTSTKTDYLALDLIDPASLTVTAVYTDGSTAPIDLSLCSIFPSLDTPLSADINNISVNYGDSGSIFNASVSVNVAPVLSIDVSGIENVSLYESRPMLTPVGLTVTAYYDDLKTISKTVTAFDIKSSTDLVMPDLNNKFKATITVDTFSSEIEFNALPIVSYRITGIKEIYYYGDQFTASDIKILAIYSDMTTYDVTSQVTAQAPETVLHGSELSLTHNGFDLKDYIKTEFPVGTLVVISAPSKVKYDVGESFNPAGLDIAIEYSNGEKRFLNPGDYTVTASEPLTAADKVVKIGYFGASANVEISVGDEVYITSLKIIGAPDKLNYFEGDLLSTSGLNIEATFSDGTKSVVAPGVLTFNPSLDTKLTVGTTTVTISANDGTPDYCSTELHISVQEKRPTGLLAVTKPTKLSYTEGEVFVPDGLSLCLFFNDGTSIIPSVYSFSPELGTPLLLHSNVMEKMLIYAVYEYEGEQYTYPIEITVAPEEVVNLVIARTPAKTEYEVGETFDPTGLELLLIYKNWSIVPQSVPTGYYTITPSVIAEDTTEVIFEYRGLKASFAISVNGVTTPPEQTTEPTPPDTTPEPPITDPQPPITTEITTSPDDPTTTEPIITTEPDNSTEPGGTSDITDITTVPDESSDITTGVEENTTGDGSEQGGKKVSSLLVLWIVIIVIIIAALVALIIYYKKNFT